MTHALPSLILFDTSTLPRRSGVNSNPLLAALGRIARAMGVEVAITDVVLAESLSARRRAADDAIESLARAARSIERVFPGLVDDLYIPSNEEAVLDWESDLRRHFTVVATHAEDAVGALLREAYRAPPARQQGDFAIGSRDASIWLTAKRLAGSSPVLLVSENTRDFATDGALRVELSNELRDGQTVLYATSIAAAVKMLASPAETAEISDDDAAEMNLNGPVIDACLDRLAPDSLAGQVFFAADPVYEQISERRAFQFSGGRLAQVRIIVSLGISNSDGFDSSSRRMQLDAWIFRPEDGAVAVEVERASPID